MAIRGTHILVPATDRDASARFLADLFGLEVTDRSAGAPRGRFAVVQVEDTSIDYDTTEKVEPIHVAFLVADGDFDRIVAGLKARGISYSADPAHRHRGEINDNEGGRGLYFRDPDGHNFELLTRG